jgi:hypothetical protein
MALVTCLDELRNAWLPHVTDAGLCRLIELLESDSPLLIHGAFSHAMPMGCLATHIAWHHPRTAECEQEAGIMWLSRVAGLNPGTSRVIRAWDDSDRFDWQLRAELLAELRAERDRRRSGCSINASTCELIGM